MIQCNPATCTARHASYYPGSKTPYLVTPISGPRSPSKGNHVDAFKFLVKKGAKVNTALNGATPLMEAVDKGKREMVEYLVKSASSLNLNLNHKDQEGANVLFYCVAGGHLGLFKFLLNSGCDVQTDDRGRSLLMQACLSGYPQMAQYLATNAHTLGIDIYQKDKEGRNALFYCVEGGHLHLLEYLIERGIQVFPDSNGRTLLMQASRAGNQAIVQFLLDHMIELNLDLHAVDNGGENAMFYAARSQDIEVIISLLESGIEISNNKSGVNVLSQSMSEGQDKIVSAILNSRAEVSKAVNGKDDQGRSIFHHCILKGDIELLKKLSPYYDRSLDGDKEGITILMRACQMKDDTLVCHLVEQMRVDIHKVDLRNRSALFYAIESSNLAALTYLLDKMEKILDDNHGRSVVMTAIMAGDMVMVELLLSSKFGKNLANRTDHLGRNACHHAAILGKESYIGLLNNYGCDLDLQDQNGATPLMRACAKGYIMAVAFLLRNGIDIDKQDNNKQTALHYCFFADDPSLRCVKILTNYGADLNDCDSEGKTPLMLACQTCAETHIPVISYLLHRGADPCLQDSEGKDAFEYCPFHSTYVKAMMRRAGAIPPNEKAALEVYMQRLEEELEVISVTRGLLQKHVFTKTLNFEVMKRPPGERVQRLLEILCTRGRIAFRKFCAVLKEEGELELSYGLMKAAYRKQHEILV